MLSSSQQQVLLEISEDSIKFDVSMARYSTFKAGGQAAALVDVQDKKQLTALLRYCRQQNISWRVIGRGSNILVTDSGFAGVICRLAGEFKKVQQLSESDPTVITAGGGCLLAELLAWCRQHGLGGLEFLAGIPGGTGGAIRMNAGAFGREIGELLQSVMIAGPDGALQVVPVGNIIRIYRHCAVDGLDMDQCIILAATLRLRKSDCRGIQQKMEKYVALRKKKQPVIHPSAGSFFKNPKDDYAGRLIEISGLKGLRSGGAMVSSVHANFIINAGGKATATDIITLMHNVQEKVQKQTGIFLEPEVHIF
jgi:UDP-N-acetylmuramate dehydrogenase